MCFKEKHGAPGINGFSELVSQFCLADFSRRTNSFPSVDLVAQPSYATSGQGYRDIISQRSLLLWAPPTAR